MRHRSLQGAAQNEEAIRPHCRSETHTPAFSFFSPLLVMHKVTERIPRSPSGCEDTKRSTSQVQQVSATNSRPPTDTRAGSTTPFLTTSSTAALALSVSKPVKEGKRVANGIWFRTSQRGQLRSAVIDTVVIQGSSSLRLHLAAAMTAASAVIVHLCTDEPHGPSIIE
jgi:hypothetical protein